MTWVAVGLGNPDEEYARTRHNAGRMALEQYAKLHEFGEWKEDKKSRSRLVRGAREKVLVVCIAPNTYMNKSGAAVLHYVKSIKAAEKLVVVYDDLDLPFGTIKISFDRGSGGHKGVDSIMKALKTRRFCRIRIGIARAGVSAEAAKPHGEEEVEKFILGEFTSKEFSELPDVFKRVSAALDMLLIEGREKAMTLFNA